MKHFTKGFHLARFALFPSTAPVDSSNLPDSATLQILSQPFTYLHRGAQCYVFQSEDQNYVIKIFQRQQKVFSPQKRPIDFSACFIAYRLAKKETALHYMHLAPTKQLLPKLSIRAPLGQRFFLPLDRYAFVIQKKVRPFHETLIQASREKKLQIYLRSFLSLLDQRLAKGIRNKDRSLSSNFGFLGEQAIEFDFGRYVESPEFLQPGYQALEKSLFVAQLRDFIERYLPNDLEVLQQVLIQ